MSEVPDSLLFTNDHEWLRLEDDGAVTVSFFPGTAQDG